MTTLDDVLRIQSQEGILSAPTDTSSTSTSTTTVTTHSAAVATASTTTSSTADTLTITLQNNTTSETLYAAVSGLAIDNDSALFLLESDGSTYYYPDNPSSNGSALAVEVNIPVGGPGSSITVTVPHLAGARIWYAQDTKLVFTLNTGTSGAALVEPSVTNQSDSNYSTRWDFTEFTYNSTELFANITYVDFVSIPAALSLESSDGSDTQTVEGMPSDGLTTVCEALQAQQAIDCAGWDSLVVQVSSGGTTEYLRALSPNCGIVMNSSLFDGYYSDYVDEVWTKYASSTLTINTQYSWGDVTGETDSTGTYLSFDSGDFPKPSAADIFSCSTGTFASYATNTEEMGNIGARLAAAFNRSTLLSTSTQPDGNTAADYYQTSPTNHYSRIVHATNLDNRGYAFPYDDVTPDDGTDQAGAVSSGSPSNFTVFIGGGDSSGASRKARSVPIRLRDMARNGRQLVGGRRHFRRSVPTEVDDSNMSSEEKALVSVVQKAMAPFYAADSEPQRMAVSDPEKIDLEKGLFAGSADSHGDISISSTKGGLAAPPSRAVRTRARLMLLIHEFLCHLWALIAMVARSVWAFVPRPIAAPLGAACAAVAASPAVASMTSAASSAAHWAVSSAVVRPLVVRTAVAGTLVMLYVAAGASPLMAALVAGLTGGSAESSQAPAAMPTLVLDAAANGTVAGSL